MRIAFVVPSIGRLEGQGNVDRELLIRVVAAGHHVDLYAGIAEPIPGVRVRRIPRLPAWQLGNQLIALVWTTVAMVGRRYDIVHADAGVTLRRADVMVCHTVTDRWRAIPDATAEGGLRGLNASIATRFKAWLEVRQYRRAGHVFANSEQTEADLRARGIERVSVMPFGVDADHFRPPTADERATARASFGVDDDRFVIATVGALGPRKGSSLLLSIVRPDERLIIAGDRRGISIEQVGVTAPGKLSDVRRAYWAADAFAYPSRYDAFGMAILEAMACGLPVVASDQAGASPIVADAGFVIDPLDGAAWRRALDDLASDRGRRMTFGVRARQIASARDWDKAGAMLTDRYGVSSGSA